MIQTAQIPIKKSQGVVTFLYLLLVDEYALSAKTRTAHQQINGSNYFQLNWFLESQYNELDIIISEITEKTRSLGHFALYSPEGHRSIDQIDENCVIWGNSEKIFEMLENQHKSIIHTIQNEIFPISAHLKEFGATYFIAGIMERHKKMASILRLYMSVPELTDNKQIRRMIPQTTDNHI